MVEFAIKDCTLAILATGRRAQTLREMRDILRDIHSGCIYHHFWGTLLRPQFSDREYNNDFATWCHHSLHDNRAAERLAVIDPAGYSDLESLRQEAGYILVGNEHDKTTSPLEAGIGWTVKFDKESFNGKDALLKMLHRGLSRSLVWFKLSQDVVVSTGDPVLVGDQKIGHVTSSAYSPTFRRGIALAYVEPRFAIPGVEFSIGTAEGEHRATLSTMPLYDPGDVRSKDW